MGGHCVRFKNIFIDRSKAEDFRFCIYFRTTENLFFASYVSIFCGAFKFISITETSLTKLKSISQPWQFVWSTFTIGALRKTEMNYHIFHQQARRHNMT